MRLFNFLLHGHIQVVAGQDLCWMNTLTLEIAHQDPLWHKGFSALYSMLAPRQLPSKPFRCIDTLTLAIACKIHHDMEVFQLFTTCSHPGSCPPRPSVGLLYQHLDDPGNCLWRPIVTWRCFDFVFHDYTKIESSGFSFFPAQNIVLTLPWPRHGCHTSLTTLQVS